MKNRITVKIRNQEYHFLAEEDEAYLHQCAAIVDKSLREIMDAGRISLSDGAVLTAMNLADLYCKERESSDNLRRQLKEALDETARVSRELADAKRELAKQTAAAAASEGE